VIVAEIESAPDPLDFEIDPVTTADPTSLFTYRSTVGVSGTFPNHVGTLSSHAELVAQNFFGEGTGVSTGLRHVNNYETDYFYGAVILPLEPLTACIFNQSFEFGFHNAAQDLAYDDYIAKYHTIIASGIGDGGPILSPADCYNGIGVAAYGGSTSVGPTADGRCKPDITAPGGATSWTTPLVSGAAAILVQAGRGQGADASVAVDSRTVKALLLNGAGKPPGWTHTATAPLDPNYGAGILNVYNSYADLAGGRHAPAAQGLSQAGQHPPLTGGASIAAAQGWDYRTIESKVSAQGVSHYRITTASSGTLASTLVWNKGYRQTAINRLYLYLYNSSGKLLASSVSEVDNVQHLYVAGLSAGTYELEVVKIAGHAGIPGVVSGREVYALAWDFDR
jgi:hypothetical protein